MSRRDLLIHPDFFSRSADRVAQCLLGTKLCLSYSGKVERWKIVEIETKTDLNPENLPAAGFVRVLRRGRHHFLSLVAGRGSHKALVIIRALEPEYPCDISRLRVCSGPGRLTEFLGIGPQQNGLSLDGQDVIWLEHGTTKPKRSQIVRQCLERKRSHRRNPRLVNSSSCGRWHLKSSPSVS